jgi:hypothetical protein
MVWDGAGVAQATMRDLRNTTTSSPVPLARSKHAASQAASPAVRTQRTPVQTYLGLLFPFFFAVPQVNALNDAPFTGQLNDSGVLAVGNARLRT